jgi:hypothetical protein
MVRAAHPVNSLWKPHLKGATVKESGCHWKADGSCGASSEQPMEATTQGCHCKGKGGATGKPMVRAAHPVNSLRKPQISFRTQLGELASPKRYRKAGAAGKPMVRAAHPVNSLWKPQISFPLQLGELATAQQSLNSQLRW